MGICEGLADACTTFQPPPTKRYPVVVMGLVMTILADLCVVLDEEEEDDILPEVVDGEVEGEGGVCLEHVVQQGCTQLGKVTRVQVVLGGRRGTEVTHTRTTEEFSENGYKLAFIHLVSWFVKSLYTHLSVANHIKKSFPAG